MRSIAAKSARCTVSPTMQTMSHITLAQNFNPHSINPRFKKYDKKFNLFKKSPRIFFRKHAFPVNENFGVNLAKLRSKNNYLIVNLIICFNHQSFVKFCLNTKWDVSEEISLNIS